MKKSLQSILFTLVLGSTALIAQDTSSLLQSEVRLSTQVLHSYRAHHSTAGTLKQMKAIHRKLHAASHDAESANVLRYLDLCLARLEKAVHKSPTPSQIEKVGDLTHEIREGSRYLSAGGMGTLTVAVR